MKPKIIDRNNYLKALAADDKAAFNSIFLKYYQELLYFAKCILPYPSDEAEDIVTEVFCTLWNKRQSILIERSLSSYLYVSVRNRILDYLKKQKLELAELEEAAIKSDPAYLEPDQLLAYRELNERILYLIGKLPKRTRLVFQMSRNEDLTYEEIASILDISINSVKTHMFRALQFIKKAFLQGREAR